MFPKEENCRQQQQQQQQKDNILEMNCKYCLLFCYTAQVLATIIYLQALLPHNQMPIFFKEDKITLISIYFKQRSDFLALSLE